MLKVLLSDERGTFRHCWARNNFSDPNLNDFLIGFWPINPTTTALHHNPCKAKYVKPSMLYWVRFNAHSIPNACNLCIHTDQQSVEWLEDLLHASLIPFIFQKNYRADKIPPLQNRAMNNHYIPPIFRFKCSRKISELYVFIDDSTFVSKTIALTAWLTRLMC